MSTYSESCNQIFTVKPSNSWDEHLENRVSIQHLSRKLRETPFPSEIDKTTSNTNTLFLRKKEIKTLVIFPTSYLHTCCLNRLEHMDDQHIVHIVFCYSEQFIASVTPCFLRVAQSSFGLLCFACPLK